MSKKFKVTPMRSEEYVCPGLTKAEAQIAGPELRKIAEAHKVNDFRQLDPEMVWNLVESDKSHPLRQLYDLDPKKAARAHWIEATRRIISGIRVVTVDIPKRKSFEPLFIRAEAPTKSQGSSALRRSHVMRSDVLANDPVFMSAMADRIRRMNNALREAEHMAEARQVPEYIGTLLVNLRECLNRYYGAGVDVAAQ